MTKCVIYILSLMIAMIALCGCNVKNEDMDISWIDAYYNYATEHSEYDFLLLNVLRMVDLDFDGVPEIFAVSHSDGSYGVRYGLTYKNGEVIPIDIEGGVTEFVGTIQDAQGRTLWHTYHFPYAPHRWPSTSQYIRHTDFSDISNIVWVESLYIGFYDAKAYSNERKIQVSVERFYADGRSNEIALTAEEYESYISWYEGDADIGEGIHLLPHLARWEAELNITPQKSIEVDIRNMEYDENGKFKKQQLFDYQDFKIAMLQWYQ